MAFVSAAATRLPRSAPVASCTTRASSFHGLVPSRAPRGSRAGSMFSFGAASSTAVKKGDRAPDFSAKDQAGNTVSLSDFVGKRNLVMFFYPKDFTPGCTKQVCAFRDAITDFQQLDAAVVGVSSGSAGDHSSFDDKFKLKFPLLVDDGNRLRSAFGVPSTFGVLPGRVTYVIDKNGIVQDVYNSQMNVTEHVNVARKALQSISA